MITYLIEMRGISQKILNQSWKPSYGSITRSTSNSTSLARSFCSKNNEDDKEHKEDEEKSKKSSFANIQNQMREEFAKNAAFKETFEDFQKKQKDAKEKLNVKFEEFSKTSKENIDELKKNEQVQNIFSKISEKLKDIPLPGVKGKIDMSKLVPKKIQTDETTWKDAFREVFGRKPIDKIQKREEMIRQRRENLKNAAKKEENNENTTEPDIPEVDIPVEKSYLQIKMEEFGEKISKLEEKREKVSPSSDTPDIKEYKNLNKEIKFLRSEMQKTSAAINTTAIVFQETEQGTWDKFSESFKSAPIVGDILGFGKKIQESETIKKAKDAAEDARNVFETSQNPVVYRMYNVYEGVFKENEHAEAVKEFKINDPEFSVETMNTELEEEIIPKVLNAYLRADLEVIDENCESEALNSIKASINMRRESKQKMDPNILSIDNVTLLTMKNVDKVGPVAIVQFMVQQIDCMYDLEGNVVKGKDDKVVAVFYIMAVTRKYSEVELRHRFYCREFAVVGQQQYL